MLYFVSDLPVTLSRMVRFLAPGGALFIVFADEDAGYSGHAVRTFISGGGDTGDNAGYARATSERTRLLLRAPHGDGAIMHVLAQAGIDVRIEVTRQRSRLYGHTLADLLALSAITELADVPGIAKFETARNLLRDAPESVDLRIEDAGPRTGMWSVTQPQWVVVIRRVG